MGRGTAEAAGVQLGVPDALQMQLDVGSMLGLFSLGSSQRVQGSWQGGDHSMLGMVTRGDSFFLFCFFDALGMSAFGWALHTHTGTIPGPRCLVPGLFLVLRGEEGKASVQRIREGSVELMSQASPGSPRFPRTSAGKGSQVPPRPSLPPGEVAHAPSQSGRQRGRCPGRGHPRGVWQARKGIDRYHQGCQVVLQTGHRRSLLSPRMATQAPYFLNPCSVWPLAP